MDGIEEEGWFLTDPTHHPKMQMHLEEIDDRRVAIIFKNSIPILYMIRLFAFPLHRWNYPPSPSTVADKDMVCLCFGPSTSFPFLSAGVPVTFDQCHRVTCRI